MAILNQEKVRSRIIALRKKAKLSQRKLAEELGSSRTYYCSIEGGKQDISESYVKHLANYYKIPVHDIIGQTHDFDAGFRDGLSTHLDFVNKLCSEINNDNLRLIESYNKDDYTPHIIVPCLTQLGYNLEFGFSLGFDFDYDNEACVSITNKSKKLKNDISTQQFEDFCNEITDYIHFRLAHYLTIQSGVKKISFDKKFDDKTVLDCITNNTSHLKDILNFYEDIFTKLKGDD